MPFHAQLTSNVWFCSLLQYKLIYRKEENRAAIISENYMAKILELHGKVNVWIIFLFALTCTFCLWNEYIATDIHSATCFLHNQQGVKCQGYKNV